MVRHDGYLMVPKTHPAVDEGVLLTELAPFCAICAFNNVQNEREKAVPMPHHMSSFFFEKKLPHHSSVEGLHSAIYGGT